METRNNLVKRILAVVLCLSLLLASAVALGETTSNVTDAEGPKLTDFTFKQNGKTLKPGDKLDISLRATDRSGISYVQVGFYSNDKNVDSLWVSLSYDAEEDLYKSDYTLEKSVETGTYYVGYISADDQFGNSKSIWSSSKGTLGKFKFKGTKPSAPPTTQKEGDTEGPKISSGKIKQKGKTLKAGDTVHIEVNAKDNSGLRTVEAYLYMQGEFNYDEKTGIEVGNYHRGHWFNLAKKSGNVYQGDFTLPKDMVNGKYYLEIYAVDKYYNSSWKLFEKQYFTFTDADYVTSGIEYFLEEIYYGITYDDPTEAQINDLGMKLAQGKITGVEAVKSVLDSANLSTADQVIRLYETMKGSEPSDSELADWTAKLEAGTSVKDLIDKLAESKNFRQLCNDSMIKAGSFGTKSEGVEIGAETDTKADTKVKKIKLNEKKKTLRLSGKNKEKKFQLKATVTPKDATDTSVTWTSSDTSVAKVNSKGKVTAVGVGTCTITCTANDGSGKSAKCKITVKKK